MENEVTLIEAKVETFREATRLLKTLNRLAEKIIETIDKDSK